MIGCLLLSLLLPLAVADEAALARSEVSVKDLEKMVKDVRGYFGALSREDLGEQKESLDKLNDALAKAAKRVRQEQRPLAFLADFEILLELAKEEPDALKRAAGKGFVKHSYLEANDEVSLGVMISLPPTYGKDDELPPAIVALKPPLGLEGESLETRVRELATAAYGGLIATHVIVIPLGPDVVKAKRAESRESVAWFSDEGLYAFYTGLRVLLEEIRFDRSRLVLDGWTGATPDALTLASTSSFFCGLLLRSGPVAVDALIPENLVGIPVLYVKGNDASAPEDLTPLTSSGVEGLDVRTVDEPGSALAPGPETLAAIVEWVGASRRDLAPARFAYRLGDLRFQARNWCKATLIERRVTARPGDADFPRFAVKADRSKNRIEIDSVNVLEMELSLSDALIDMSAPVTVVVNGETRFEGRLKPTLRSLLDNRFYNNSQDYGLYTDQILLEDLKANVPR